MTPKQEKFCTAYIECGSATEAHRLAGYGPRMTDKTRNEAASRLLANSKIVARISELRAAHVDRHNVTVDDLTDALIADRQMARRNDQSAAAISATMSIARLFGLADGHQKINFPLKPIEDAEDAKTAMAEVVKGLSDGRLRPSDAKALADAIEAYRRQLDTLAEREAWLEIEETLRRFNR